MGAMLVPALIGAGVGAVGGAAMGKNPFTTALLGAGLGAGGAGLLGAGGAAGSAATTAGTMGVGAGEGLIGGANLTGAGIASGAGASATSGGLGSLLSGIHGVETVPVSFGTGGYASGIGGQVLGNVASPVASAIGNGEMGSSLLTNSKGTPLSMMDKVGNYVSNLPSNAMNYVKENPLSSAKMALDVASPSQQPIQTQVPPILRGNFDPSSALFNVSPNVNPTAGSKTGLIDAMAHIPMTDEERMRLQQLAQYGYRG